MTCCGAGSRGGRVCGGGEGWRREVEGRWWSGKGGGRVWEKWEESDGAAPSLSLS